MPVYPAAPHFKKMTNLNLGTNINVDLENLIDTRLLICANSGGGKSYAVRKLLEESHGKVMTIILDIEGEYKTLREKYDFLLIGSDGDVPLSLKATSLLPRKLMDLQVSTIIDISELKSTERVQYVKKFLTALVELPKKYWKPCMVIVEECHKFCGQQDKYDSGPAIIDLMTRGRKRGYCGVLITQRIAKLHKDAAAECNNVLVGRMWLDNDQKRAGDILGFTSKDTVRGLRLLPPGEFYMFGPAITSDVDRGKVGEVKTSHPKVGMKIDVVAPPTEKITKMLSELSSLPIEVEKEVRTLNDCKKRIRELEREIRQKPKPKIDEKYLQQVKERSYIHAKKELERNWLNSIKTYESEIKSYQKKLDKIGTLVKMLGEHCAIEIQITKKSPDLKSELPISNNPPQNRIKKVEKFSLNYDKIYEDEELKLSPAYTRLLKACASYHPDAISKPRLSFLANIPQKASTFRNGLSKLKTTGLIIKDGEGFLITDNGLELAGDFDRVPTDSQSLINMWKSRLSPAYQRILMSVFESYPQPITKEDISEQSEIPIEASTFRNGLSKLKTLGLIKVNNQEVIVHEDLFAGD